MHTPRCQGLSKLSSGRQHFDDPRSGLFYALDRVQKEVQEECRERGLWHLGLVENVVCDEADQEFFGTLSHVRRPRFFWVSEPISPGDEGILEDHGLYQEVKVFGPKEPPEIWECPGWTWVSRQEPVSLPTFTIFQGQGPLPLRLGCIIPLRRPENGGCRIVTDILQNRVLPS